MIFVQSKSLIGDESVLFSPPSIIKNTLHDTLHLGHDDDITGDPRHTDVDNLSNNKPGNDVSVTFPCRWKSVG